MRTDLPDTTTGLAGPPAHGRTSPPRPRAARAVPVMVGGLVLGTSAAVAAVAWWLVPPYLLLMAFLLVEPAGRRVSATNPAGPGSAPSEAPASAAAPDPAESAASDEPHAPADVPPAPKARRSGKGRGSKKARPAAEPAPATWVQVAPGKFVRVEPGNPPAGPGPHTSTAPDPSTAPAVTAAGPHDVPQEAALEPPHPEPASAEGPAPDAPRVTESDDEGMPRDEAPRADLAASDRDVVPDPGPRPDPGAPRVEAAEADPIRRPEALATDERDPDPAAGTQPEATAGVPVDPEARGIAVAVEPPAEGESEVESAVPGDGTAPDPHADDGARAEGLAPEADAPFSVAATIDAGLAPAGLEAPTDPTAAETDASLAAPGDEPGARETPGEAAFAADPLDARPGPDVAPGPADRPDAPAFVPPPEAGGMSASRGTVARWFGRGVPPPRRNVRPSHPPRRPHGLRLRSRRGDGRPRHFARTFPPRSPPRGVMARA